MPVVPWPFHQCPLPHWNRVAGHAWSTWPLLAAACQGLCLAPCDSHAHLQPPSSPGEQVCAQERASSCPVGWSIEGEASFSPCLWSGIPPPPIPLAQGQPCSPYPLLHDSCSPRRVQELKLEEKQCHLDQEMRRYMNMDGKESTGPCPCYQGSMEVLPWQEMWQSH